MSLITEKVGDFWYITDRNRLLRSGPIKSRHLAAHLQYWQDVLSSQPSPDPEGDEANIHRWRYNYDQWKESMIQ